jgi:hypothetical protein
MGFINKPAATNRMSTRPSRVNQQRRETLHPPINRDVINVDATFIEQFFNIAIGQSVTQIPAHRQQDRFRREPVPSKR